ncbi:Lipoprotein signal peptidase [Corynebacterium capitovis DSM 44611]|nr:Lipoprotein signal peptidase [Corynebacterium capitovis DSM 44611]
MSAASVGPSVGPGAGASATAGEQRRYVGTIVGVMLAVAALDQAVKQLVLAWVNPGEPIHIIGDWFRLLLVFNPGAAFSMGSDATWVFTTIQLVFVVGSLIAAPRITSPWEAAGLALVAGGALGNLTDRLIREPSFWFGHVVDYISVGSFAVFNLADAAITVGVGLFIVALFFGDGRE